MDRYKTMVMNSPKLHSIDLWLGKHSRKEKRMNEKKAGDRETNLEPVG